MFFSSFLSSRSTLYVVHNSSRKYTLRKFTKTVVCSKKTYSQKQNIIPTTKQSIYEKFMRESTVPLVIGVGPAGTGKTHFACKIALEHLENKTINKIIITRPTIAVGQNIGFLPGDIEAKMEPWLIPIYDNFVKSVDDNKLIKNYFHNNYIEICPLSYIRGRTFDNCFVIADEMQNSSISEMKSLVTRIGYDSKLVITGDIKQSDIQDDVNGLEDLMSLLEKKNIDTNQIKYVIFDKDDVKRSEFVKYILELYES